MEGRLVLLDKIVNLFSARDPGEIFDDNAWENVMLTYSRNHGGAPYNDTLEMVDLGRLPSPVHYKPAVVANNQVYYRFIGVHHLTPIENKGKHNIFITVLKLNGERERPFWVGWTWAGRRPSEAAPPVNLDKPNNEPAGNLSMGGGQIIEIWPLGRTQVSNVIRDQVFNLHTLHPDEHGPGGENWNSVGHHSFFVLFKEEIGPPSPIPEPEPEPEPEPPPGDKVKVWNLSVSGVGIRVKLNIEVDRW